jgi:hypothetical protein
LKTKLPAKTVGRLTYYIDFDFFLIYWRREKYLMVTHNIDITEKRDEACTVKWSCPGFMRAVSEYIKELLLKKDLTVSRCGTSFNFAVTFNVKRDKEYY